MTFTGEERGCDPAETNLTDTDLFGSVETPQTEISPCPTTSAASTATSANSALPAQGCGKRRGASLRSNLYRFVLCFDHLLPRLEQDRFSCHPFVQAFGPSSTKICTDLTSLCNLWEIGHLNKTLDCSIVDLGSSPRCQQSPKAQL